MMVNKPKAQGTAFETWLVNEAKAQQHKAWRLAEGGQDDAGDVFIDPYDWYFLDSKGVGWVIEAKATTNLNPHKALAKARAKAKNADLPHTVRGVAVIHKRLIRKTGNQRRSADGEPIVVYLTLEDFLQLI